MNYDELYAQGQQRTNELLSQVSLDEAKAVATGLMEDLQDAAQEAFEWAMCYLESAMPEDEFVAFCESM